MTPDLTVVVDEHVRRLGRDAEHSPDLAIDIGDMIEAVETKVVDKDRHLVGGVLT